MVYKPSSTQSAISLNGTSGSSQTNKNRILVSAANTLPFVPGDEVMVYDSATPWGETATVQQVVSSGSTPYLETTSNLTGDYTVAQSAKVVLLSAFTSMRTTNATGTITTVTKPCSEEVLSLINQAEAYIETKTKMAWRVKTQTEETHDFPLRVFTSRDWLDGIPIKLNFRNIRGTAASDSSYKLDTSEGDKLEVYGGGTWQDWTSLYTGGRSHQWWLDKMRGIIYLRSFYKIYSRLAVRVTYRYGFSSVPYDIKRATALLVAAQLSESEDRVAAFPAGEDINIVPVSEKASRWRKEAETIIQRYTEQVSIW
jgi:hypothetical protein